MDTPIKIRRAIAEDYSPITKLTNQLGYPSTEKKVKEILNMVLTHDDHEIFVATADENVVGYIHLVCTMRLGSEPFIEIAAIIVDEDYRSRGVGHALLDRTQEYAESMGYSVIRIRSNIVREPAHKFFTEQGYVNLKTQEVFMKELMK